MEALIKKFFTGFLYVTPTFLFGSGSVMNISGNYFEYYRGCSSSDADTQALKNDFGMAGQDYFTVLNRELNTNKNIVKN